MAGALCRRGIGGRGGEGGGEVVAVVTQIRQPTTDNHTPSPFCAAFKIPGVELGGWTYGL
jgi:hypothetical protein